MARTIERMAKQPGRFHHLMNGLSAGCTAFLVGVLVAGAVLLILVLQAR